MTATRVVFGPRTRLGRLLLASGGGRARTVAMARHDADVEALTGSGHQVLSPDSDAAAFQEAFAGDGPVQVSVCALGPLHPGEPDQAIVSAGVSRDLALIGRVLEASVGRRVHVLLVSTVVALAPAFDRRFYGGWKGLLEEELRQMVGSHATRGEFSVLYPGRLVERRDFHHPASLMYTTYRRLAHSADRAVASRPVSRVTGLDARVWLVTRSVSMGVSGITGHAGGRASLVETAARVTRETDQTRGGP